MKLYYDMHIHSCLSPCADNDMIPSDIAGIGALNNLTIMALTDHNTCENCPPFFEACEFYGIIPIAGMELTTSEDIHIVCLFRQLDSAMKFSAYVYEKLMPVMNKPEIFGEQIVADIEGNRVKSIDKLLIGSTNISVEEVTSIISIYGGICYPAHIDRESNGIISILGDIPPEPGFKCAELHDKRKVTEFKSRYPILNKMRVISSSDAHRLSDINTAINHFDIPDEYEFTVLDWLFKHLNGEI